MTNCPPVYQNLQCESFSNKRKITTQILRQFCKNDAYLKEQIDLLWDSTDPESRKRFYPPDYMDISGSFSIEEHKLTEYEQEFYNYWDTVYRFNTVDRIRYVFDFKGTNDRIMGVENDTYAVQTQTIYADSYLDLENSYDALKLEIVNEEIDIGNDKKEIRAFLRPPLTEGSYEEIVNHDPIYSPRKDKIKDEEKGHYVTVKKEQLGKAKRDAYFRGADGKWDCNNHWYNGFDRTKNYNVKAKWKKDPYGEDKDIIKKYGRIPSVCHAQTFKAQNSGRINKVNLNIQGNKGAVSPCVVEIRTTKNGKPTDKVLARTTKKFTGNGENLVAFEFKTKAKIEKGKHYAIVVRSPFSHFEKTYRWGGWTTGCFSSEDKYYGDGSAYTSTDNGHSWIKNGKTKDTKSYGSHYYDWGINQKPVDFGFEVYVQPITQEKKKKWKKGSKAEYYTWYEAIGVALDHYNYSFNYYKDGSYYIHLKPIHCNPIDWFNIAPTYTNNETSSNYWKFEYYDSYSSEWEEIPTGCINDFRNSTVNYTVLKLRIRCDIEGNTLGGVNGVIPQSHLDNLIQQNHLNNTPLTFLTGFTLTIETLKPSKAYLRTQYYHPNKTDMLGASLWSEVNATAIVKGNAELKIDVIHERQNVEHILFYDLTILTDDLSNYSDAQKELFDNIVELIAEYDENNPLFSNGTSIRNFVYNDYVSNNKGFVEFLKNRITPIYILPFIVNGEWFNFFDNVKLPHIPSYPLIGGDIGDDDIIIHRSGEEPKFYGATNDGFLFSFDKSVKNTISSIIVTYKTKIPVETVNVDGENIALDENGFELNDADSEELIETRLTGIVSTQGLVNSNGFLESGVFTDTNGIYNTGVDYAISNDGMFIAFNSHSEKIRALFNGVYDVNGSTVTLKNEPSYYLTPTQNTSDYEIKVDLTTKTYQEFIDFEVDYDTGELTFYNQRNLIHGDFKVTYNPIWVRGLSIEDFPLKMDLWKEYYRVGKDDNSNKGIYKRIFNINDGVYEDDVFYKMTPINPVTKRDDLNNYYTFKTKVPPRDNIRKLVINEGTNDEKSLEEDSQFFVDYLTNTVVLYINNLEENDNITIHYTPNLIDNGLALGYRIKRPRYDQFNNPVGDDDLNAQPSNDDDVYIGMNYFTYRT